MTTYRTIIGASGAYFCMQSTEPGNAWSSDILLPAGKSALNGLRQVMAEELNRIAMLCKRANRIADAIAQLEQTP